MTELKSIWHTADEKPMLQRDIILCGDGWSMAMDIIPETVNNICWKNVKKWCYLDDLIKESDHTRKALEIAIQYIKHTQSVEPFWFNRLANKTLNEIKTALEQKE